MSDSDIVLEQRLQEEANEFLEKRTRLARSNIARLKAFKATPPPPAESKPQSDHAPELAVSLFDLIPKDSKPLSI